MSGTVVFNSAPLPAGTIGFKTADGMTSSSAKIKDGQFSTDRAPLGEVLITVSTKSVAVGNPSAYVAIPERYEDPTTSELKATITAEGATDLNFALEE
ncbi:hypothetical protein K2D_25470 [Planctomycetes bacterium K2D]|uniref:Uncharacterized protein n=1 Tax=Botrimarina mediterranea TaxID=2528022 RepID=A0A518K971_9BACT|nr:hypothetical protein Spa11_25450 [Botrimarina mediterranea]QDV78938.1 hypothetical protein K2D_25470 [Planctomycetes bacterium K2D]